MPEPKSFHMSPEEFRRQGHAVVDWIADYHARIESFPVLSQVKPRDIRAKLPATAPQHGEAFWNRISSWRHRARHPSPASRTGSHAQFLRLLSIERLRACDSRRSAFLGTRSARNALVDEPGVYGT